MLVRRVAVSAFVFAIASAAFAQVDVTGSWSGIVSGNGPCASGTGSAPESLNLSLNLQQSSGNVTGTGSATGPVDPCTTGSPVAAAQITNVSATISGSQIDGTMTIANSGGSKTVIIQAIAGSTSMTFTIFGSGSNTLQGTLTKAAAPSTDVSGTWSGTFSASGPCDNVQVNWSSPATMNLSQSGTTVSGSLLLYAAAYVYDCHTNRTFQLVLPIVSATVSGNTFSGTFPAPGSQSPASFSATVTNGTMHFNVTSKESGSGTFTKGASPVFDTHLSGSYSGTYTDTFIPCVDAGMQLPPYTYGGALSGSITQLGQTVSGTFTVTGNKKDQLQNGVCTIVDAGDLTITVAGSLSGTTLTGNVFSSDPKHNVQPFTATVSGSTITAHISTNDGSVTFSVTMNGATPPAPQILSFGATPPTIHAGQSATLSWSTNAASAIAIDNGVGSEPGSGTASVSPTATTTYTLTATQGTQSAVASVTVQVLTAPVVNVTTIPSTMLQLAGSGGATTTYALTNSGSASTTISLSQTGNFFTQSPTSFALPAGATQIVTITGTAQSQGSYEGASMIAGSGVPSGLQVAVKLVAAAAPAGSVTADPSANRVDVAQPASVPKPSGSVDFKNNGTASLTGVLNSDQPWIIPQSGTVTIAAGQTSTLNFTIDRTQRPDASALAGSTEGNLTLSFLSGGGSPFAAKPLDNTGTIPSVSLVKIIDTVQPTVSTTGIPALGASEIALFVAGVGHTTGTGGALFASDVSILNPQGSKSIDDLKMYYTSTTGTATAAKTASLPSVPSQVSVAVADVVKNVFAGTNERGTLQIRSASADKIAMSAAVVTINNPSGTYGNAIPIFRSDRAIAAGDTLILTGLRKDNTTHTNLYIQEAAGAAASVQTDFLAADGSTLGTRTDPVDPFKLLALDNIVPANAVVAVITNKSTAGGKIVAYATPLDEASGDTWAVTDWAHLYGYSGSDAAIVPVAGSVHGANNTFYRTDLALTNRGADPATVTLRYTSRTGSITEQQVTLAGKQTSVIADVISSFNLSGDSVGFLTITPTIGSVAASSRTFTTVGSKPGSFGSSVPVLAAASALALGGTSAIAGLADASRTTVLAGKPSTYRTNFGLMETRGFPVTVRVTFRFTFPAGAKVSGVGAASRDYSLNAYGFLLLNSIAGEILGPARLQYGDLTNVEADFQVVSGGGGVMLFTSSVDNATGDSILRTE